MEEVSPFAEFLGHLVYHFTQAKPYLPMYAHILIAALFPIYIGAHATLSRPSSAAKPPTEDNDEIDDEGGGEDQDRRHKIESMEPSDALMFPIMAGATLSALYLILKWMGDAAILNQILTFYFSQVGIYFMSIFLKDVFVVVRSFVFPKEYYYRGKIWKLHQSEHVFTTSEQNDHSFKTFGFRRSPLPGISGRIALPGFVLAKLWFIRDLVYQRVRFQAHVRGVQKIKSWVSLFDITSCLLAVCAVGYYAFVEKHWWLTNLFGFSFCYNTLQLMTPSTFWTGTLLLSSLFFYDIYFVFYTPMMVTVATKLEAPIKLLIPRPPTPEEAETPDALSLAMLGLGDIVIPGMVMCLALRFDLFLYYKRKGIQKAKTQGGDQKFVKPEYQSATGGWGERFWSRLIAPSAPELKPPYHDARSFRKTYFKASIIGYTLGLLTTVVIMQYFGRGQPALLYLVPGVLLSLWGTALFKGDIRDMWNFSDAEDEEETEKNKKKEEKETPEQDDVKIVKSVFLKALTSDLNFFKDSDKSQKDTKDSDSTDSADKEDSKEAKAEEKKDDSSKDPKPRKDADEEDKDLDLFSLSISLPKPQSEIHKGPFSGLSEENASEEGEFEDEFEDYSVDLIDRDDEPPAKRLRRSPRYASAS